MTELPHEKPKRHRRPRWSLKTQFGAGIVIFLVALVLILCLVEKSIWEKLEVLTSALSIMIFIYFTGVLYYGVRFDRQEKFHLQRAIDSPSDCLPYAADGDLFGVL